MVVLGIRFEGSWGPYCSFPEVLTQHHGIERSRRYTGNSEIGDCSMQTREKMPGVSSRNS